MAVREKTRGRGGNGESVSGIRALAREESGSGHKDAGRIEDMEREACMALRKGDGTGYRTLMKAAMEAYESNSRVKEREGDNYGAAYSARMGGDIAEELGMHGKRDTLFLTALSNYRSCITEGNMADSYRIANVASAAAEIANKIGMKKERKKLLGISLKNYDRHIRKSIGEGDISAAHTAAKEAASLSSVSGNVIATIWFSAITRITKG